MKRMMLIGGMAILLGLAASTVSMAQMGSMGFNPNQPQANNNSNKGGAVRGLDRADQVAGHGQQAGQQAGQQPGQEGRENARSHHKPGSPGGSPVVTPPTPDPCLGC